MLVLVVWDIFFKTIKALFSYGRQQPTMLDAELVQMISGKIALQQVTDEWPLSVRKFRGVASKKVRLEYVRSRLESLLKSGFLVSFPNECDWTHTCYARVLFPRDRAMLKYMEQLQQFGIKIILTEVSVRIYFDSPELGKGNLELELGFDPNNPDTIADITGGLALVIRALILKTGSQANQPDRLHRHLQTLLNILTPT